MGAAARSQPGPCPCLPLPPQISPSAAAAMSVLRAVEVPWGANGATVPGSFHAGDTVVSLLREHETGLYLWRSPGSPRWQGVRLRNADWSAYGGATRAIELAVGAEDWYGDLTDPGSELAAEWRDAAMQRAAAGADA